MLEHAFESEALRHGWQVRPDCSNLDNHGVIKRFAYLIRSAQSLLQNGSGIFVRSNEKALET